MFTEKIGIQGAYQLFV